MSQKRNRSINWDEEEKQLFRTVFREYAPLIENKSLDTNTNKVKNKAWEEFHNKFNQLKRRPRELTQLKIQWKSMKVNARKEFGTYKKESNRTGGGSRPPTPSEIILEIKDLLNPAELLKDDNKYDSDGVMGGSHEIHSSDTCYINSDIPCIETIEVDDEASCQKLTHEEISQEKPNETTLLEIKTDLLPVKTPVYTAKATPLTDRATTPAKKVTKRKLNLNNIINRGRNTKKDHEDYVNNMISHSKMLKDDEHMRRIEMIEEEHVIKMEIHREKLKSAILEREILELKNSLHLNKIKPAFLYFKRLFS